MRLRRLTLCRAGERRKAVFDALDHEHADAAERERALRAFVHTTILEHYIELDIAATSSPIEPVRAFRYKAAFATQASAVLDVRCLVLTLPRSRSAHSAFVIAFAELLSRCTAVVDVRLDLSAWDASTGSLPFELTEALAAAHLRTRLTTFVCHHPPDPSLMWVWLRNLSGLATLELVLRRGDALWPPSRWQNAAFTLRSFAIGMSADSFIPQRGVRALVEWSSLRRVAVLVRHHPADRLDPGRVVQHLLMFASSTLEELEIRSAMEQPAPRAPRLFGQTQQFWAPGETSPWLERCVSLRKLVAPAPYIECLARRPGLDIARIYETAELSIDEAAIERALRDETGPRRLAVQRTERWEDDAVVRLDQIAREHSRVFQAWDDRLRS